MAQVIEFVSLRGIFLSKISYLQHLYTKFDFLENEAYWLTNVKCLVVIKLVKL